MKRILLLVLPVLFMASCHSPLPDTRGGEKKAADTVKKDFIPVGDFLKSEIASVDSFPQLIKCYHIRQGTTDSMILTTAQFDQLSKEFLRQELDSPAFEKEFEEASFLDRSTSLLNFTYATKDTGYGLKRVDFLAMPGTGGVNKMSSIYMEVRAGNKDTAEIRKMSWKAGSYFSILHIYQPTQGTATTSITKVVWDSKD